MSDRFDWATKDSNTGLTAHDILWNLTKEGIPAPAIARALSEIFGITITEGKVYNHRKLTRAKGFVRQEGLSTTLGLREAEPEASSFVEGILRQNARLVREVAQLRDYWANLREIVEDALASSERKAVLSPSTPPKPLYSTGMDVANILDLSDVHAGSRIRSKVTGGLGVYDYEVFSQRLSRLRDEVLRRLEWQRSLGWAANRLVMNVLGDIVDGEAIYPGHGFGVEASVLEQIFDYGFDIARNLIAPLASDFPQVELFCVAGNHGRPGRKGQHNRLTNFDTILYIFWARELRDFPNVRVHISSTNFLLYDLFPGQVHALVHGQQARSWLGFPYYGIDRLAKRLTDMTGVRIYALHHGHHHSPSIQGADPVRKIGNGSFVGASEYSVNDLVMAGNPYQYWAVADSDGIFLEGHIRLDDIGKLEPDEDGLYTPTVEVKGLDEKNSRAVD